MAFPAFAGLERLYRCRYENFDVAADARIKVVRGTGFRQSFHQSLLVERPVRPSRAGRASEVEPGRGSSEHPLHRATVCGLPGGLRGFPPSGVLMRVAVGTAPARVREAAVLQAGARPEPRQEDGAARVLGITAHPSPAIARTQGLVCGNRIAGLRRQHRDPARRADPEQVLEDAPADPIPPNVQPSGVADRQRTAGDAGAVVAEGRVPS